MERIILHCDLNNFFASVECVLDPSLKERPVAVCGSVEDRHGIVLAKNMPAKAYGICTAEPVGRAVEKCPQLVIVPPHFDKYIEYSRRVRKFYERYTDYIEPFGIDECWLDVTGSTRLFGTGRQMADALREQIREGTGLTISAGVSFNKVFAKLGSDMKKPDATTEIPSGSFREIIWGLPASDMLGVGRSTARRLDSAGIKTIGDIAAMPEKTMKVMFGVGGETLWRFANGLDFSPVAHKDYLAPIKSVGRGITCVRNLVSAEECRLVMLALAAPVGETLRREELAAGGVAIEVKNNELVSMGAQCRLSGPEQDSLAIVRAAFALFKARYDWRRPVRALTVRAIDLMPAAAPAQYDIFADARFHAQRLKVENACDRIRGRFGDGSIYPAALIGEEKMPGHAAHEGLLPGSNFLSG